MENKIFEIESTSWKSLVLKDNEFWLSQNRISKLEKFETAIQKTGIMKSAQAYLLSTVSEISFNEASDSIKLTYKNEKGKQKKTTIGFESKELSNKFGHYLGNKLELNTTEKQEKQITLMLFSLLYLALTIGGTFFLATLEDSDELTSGGSRRSRNKGAFLKLIVDTLGQTGVIILGSLISIYLIYQLYKRFKNPANEVFYQK